MEQRLSGKVAIVTGSARGIGAAIARRLVEAGAQVVLTDVLDADGEAYAKSLGDGARYLHHDVTQANDWAKVVAFAESTFGSVNILVNNAGIVGAVVPIESLEEADFRQVLSVNLVSVFLGIKTVLPSMKRGKNGSIVNISSVAGFIGSAQMSSYTASKFAVRGFTKTAALECSQYGIRVNSVHPGYIDTTMIAGMIPAEQADEFKRGIAPLARLGKPEEIANMVLFLASDESSYSTGAEFTVDGGYMAG